MYTDLSSGPHWLHIKSAITDSLCKYTEPSALTQSQLPGQSNTNHGSIVYDLCPNLYSYGGDIMSRFLERFCL